MFTKENTKRLVDDDTPYTGTIGVTVLWGVDHLFRKFLVSKGAWDHVLDLKFISDRRGWFNTRVKITCEGPKDLVILWTTSFAEINSMKVKD